MLASSEPAAWNWRGGMADDAGLVDCRPPALSRAWG